MHKIHFRSVDNVLAPAFCGVRASKKRIMEKDIAKVTCKGCLKKVEDLNNEDDNSRKQGNN